MRLFIICTLLCAPLFADKIVAKFNTFEGIVTKFDKDADLTLSTGYGDLTFSMSDDVREAIACEYTWPKDKVPNRAPEFEKWANDEALISASKWALVPEKKEAKELDAASFFEQLASAQDRKKSVKDRSEAIDAFVKKGQWCYVAKTVDVVTFVRDYSVQFDSQLYDVRTGKLASDGSRSVEGRGTSSIGLSLTGSPKWTREEVDAANRKALKEFRDGSGDSVIYLDAGKARDLAKGSVIVFKLSLEEGKGNELLWIYEPIRILPRKNPIKK